MCPGGLDGGTDLFMQVLAEILVDEKLMLFVGLHGREVVRCLSANSLADLIGVLLLSRRGHSRERLALK